MPTKEPKDQHIKRMVVLRCISSTIYPEEIPTKVQKMKGTYLTLEETLRPIWKFTYYSGMMFNWCCRNRMSRLSKILHSFSIPLFLLFVTFNTVFQGFQLFIQILNKDNKVEDYIHNLMWFCTLPLSLVTCFYFIVKREKMWSFFEDWHRMENLLKIRLNRNCGNCKKLKLLITTFNWLMYGSVVFAVSLLMLYRPKASYLLSYYQQILDTTGLPLIIIFHATFMFSNFFFESLSGAVPGIIFYHTGQVLRAFKIDIKNLFNNKLNRSGRQYPNLESSEFQTEMHEIIVSYDVVSKLVKRANQLFGALMIFNHGTVLFMLVTLFYSIFYQLQRSPIDSLIYLGGSFSYLYQLLVGHLLAAQLFSSSKKLNLSLSSLLAKYSVHLSKEDYCVASNFLIHLQEDQLAACPLDLYSISYSNLLTITGLIITNVIVLLQTS